MFTVDSWRQPYVTLSLLSTANTNALYPVFENCKQQTTSQVSNEASYVVEFIHFEIFPHMHHNEV